MSGTYSGLCMVIHLLLEIYMTASVRDWTTISQSNNLNTIPDKTCRKGVVV